MIVPVAWIFSQNNMYIFSDINILHLTMLDSMRCGHCVFQLLGQSEVICGFMGNLAYISRNGK